MMIEFRPQALRVYCLLSLLENQAYSFINKVCFQMHALHTDTSESFPRESLDFWVERSFDIGLSLDTGCLLSI